jgi:rhomboid protease GluP
MAEDEGTGRDRTAPPPTAGEPEWQHTSATPAWTGEPPPGQAVFEVRFGAPSGRLGAAVATDNTFHLHGKGEVRLEPTVLKLSGRQVRSFQPRTRLELALARGDVVNVLRAGRLVRFEVRSSGEPPKAVVFTAGSEAAAARIASALPAVRTEDFERAVAEHVQFQSRLAGLSSKPVVTLTLVAINVAVYVLMGLAGAGFVNANPEVAIRWGSNFGPMTMDGQWWRLVTCMFVHFGFLHILCNMWVLYDVGRTVERLFGRVHYVALYFLTGIAASLSSLLWHVDVNSAGASGAIFGIIGGLLAFLLRKDNDVPLSAIKRYRNSLAVFVVYSLVAGFAHQGIDNAAHLGGLASGLILGYLLARPLDPERRAAGSAVRFGRAVAAGAALLAVLWVPLLRPSQATRAENRFRLDMVRFAQDDVKTATAFREAIQQTQARTLDGPQFADKIEGVLIPTWEDLGKDMEGVHLDPGSPMAGLQKACVHYISLTEEALHLYAAGARSNDTSLIQQANQKIQERQKVAQEIRDLSAKAR